MSIYYLDTSAALKLLIEENESDALATWLTASTTDGHCLCASFLLHTELHCAARRRNELDHEAVASLLSGIELIDISRSHLIDAASSSMGLRTADAIHMTVALDIQANAIVTYDIGMQNAAKYCGILPIAPS
ncbi:PIN domain-containing protein [Actinomyces viscosus]|uniref:Probable ribonuclease VapC46 n=1 Tax=Actinomyces viscosus TaxID=1656 RepID=A0A3S4Z806_ACTVI|nr:type II toxin-antitoxin system VapC family toxin [Actinomyces viscosus]TFH54055.1 PIN domain-containing protein [Actinomyces viscosus]VEI15165.1 Probable ribonuclease VapC46 [Actinomyces viscosus]